MHLENYYFKQQKILYNIFVYVNILITSVRHSFVINIFT